LFTPVEQADFAATRKAMGRAATDKLDRLVGDP